MKQLFPRKQVLGFASSLILTAVAIAVYYFEMSYALGLTILLITAFSQAGLQLVVFMHAGETVDGKAIYTTIYYGLAIAIITIFGTLLSMVWGFV